MAKKTLSPVFPVDRNSVPIPVLEPGAVDKLSVASSADTNTLPDHNGIVQVCNQVDMYWKFGVSGTDAADSSDSYMPAGQVREYKVPEGATHFSVIHGPSATDGVCTVTALV